MAVTFTENLHLGMQKDKTDYLDWDAITDNWEKIDAAVSGGGGIGAAGSAVVRANGISVIAAGYAQRQTADFTEFGLAESSFNDNTGAITEDTGTGKLGTQNMIPIPTDATIVVVNAVTQSQQNLEWFCYLYDANGDYLSSESSTSYSGQKPYDWKTSTKMQQIPPTAKYLRFGLRISSSLPALTPSDIESAIALF